MYNLPDLPYEYNSLEPFIDEETLRLHHDKHHASYVKGANEAVEKLEEARKEGDAAKIRSAGLSLSFNLSGHSLHSLFWESMCPEAEYEQPEEKLMALIVESFGSYEHFLTEFKAVAMKVEGSGWSALFYDDLSDSLLIAPIEKHNLLGIQGAKPILVLDVWEHAYYLKYRNDRQSFVDSFEKIINWKTVEKKLGY